MQNGLYDHEKLERASELLKVIAHPSRIGIIRLLEDKNRMTVSEIFERLNLEQAVVSQHLRLLKDKGVLMCEREGKNRYYFLKNQQFSKIIKCISGICE